MKRFGCAFSALSIIAAALLAMLIMTGCKEEGPMEKAGKQTDKAVENAGEKLEDAGDEIKDATDGK